MGVYRIIYKFSNISQKEKGVLTPFMVDALWLCHLEPLLAAVGETMLFGSVGASTLARNKNYYKPQKCGLFYVKFYLFLCCTELYFIFICDIMRYETQL